MFTVEKIGTNLIQIEIGGKITAEEMSRGLDALMPLTAQMEDGAVLAIYQDIEFPEAGALFEEMKRLPELFGMVGRVRKVALVSNQKWIRDMAELEGKVIPGMTVRSFEPKDRAQADAFVGLTGAPAAEPDEDDNFPV